MNTTTHGVKGYTMTESKQESGVHVKQITVYSENYKGEISEETITLFGKSKIKKITQAQAEDIKYVVKE